MSERHTYKVLLAAGLPAAVSTALATIGGRGNCISLEIITTGGGAGVCTFTLESSPDGGTNYFQVYDLDSQASWTIDVNVAGKYELTLPVGLIPQQLYRLSYSCAVAAGTIAIAGIRWENPAGSMDISIGDVVADLSTLESAIHLEDVAHVSGDAGTMPLGVRNDTLASLCDTDGDYAPLQVSNIGALYSEVVAMPGGLTGHAEDDAHVTGDVGVESLAVRNDTLASLCDTDGDYAPLQVSDIGALYTVDKTAEALLTTIDTDTSTIATDTTSIDGKTPALGTAVMAGSSPMTIATDDTLTTAANALLTTIDTDMGVMRADLAATKTAVEIMDDWDATHDSAVPADGVQTMAESKDFDGSALPNPVGTEGDAVRPAASLTGIGYSMLTNKNGSGTPTVTHSAIIQNGEGTVALMTAAEAKDFDGSALPNSVTEGDATRMASSGSGVAYQMPVTSDGSETPIVAESAAISAANGGSSGMMAMVQARDTQKTAVTEDDAVRPVANANGELVVAGFDWSAESITVAEQSPLDQQYVNESLVDTTNVAATTHYYPSSSGDTMDGYKDMSLTGKLIDADGTLTLSLECMNDEDTAAGDWNSVYFYDDVANANVLTQTVTNGTITFAVSANNNNFRRFRWGVTASGATNTVILKQRRKAL
jgi:hypothetical protein